MGVYSSMPQKAIDVFEKAVLYSIADVVDEVIDGKINCTEWLHGGTAIEGHWSGRVSGELTPDATRMCTRCGELKATARFRQMKYKRPDGRIVPRYCARCRACESEINNRHLKVKRRTPKRK